MRSYTLPIFLLCCSLALLIFFIGRIGWLDFLSSNIQNILFPVGTVLTNIHLPQSQKSDELENLKVENVRLTMQLAKMTQLQQDNAALRDQFDTTTIPSKTLLPVSVVGMPNAIPNLTFPETLIINAGIKEGVQKGSVIVVKDEAIGIVDVSSDDYANVQLATNKQSSFSVKTSQSNAIGIVKGQGNGELIMDNVLLSDTLTVGDSIVTLGNQDVSGKGYPPGLIVGKIVSVDKNPSSLFQQARVMPLVRFDRLSTIFVIR